MKYLLIIFAILPSNCFAASFSSASSTSFSIGVSYFSMGLLDKVSTSKKGTADTMGTTYFPVQLGMFTNIFGYDFNPRLLITPVSKDSDGGGAKESFYSLYLPMSFPSFLSDWVYSAGFGIFSFNIDGEGGIAKLNNGTGTSDFAKPGLSSSSRLYYLGAGVGRSWESIRLDLDLFVMAPGSSERRSFNLNTAISYLF